MFAFPGWMIQYSRYFVGIGDCDDIETAMQNIGLLLSRNCPQPLDQAMQMQVLCHSIIAQMELLKNLHKAGLLKDSDYKTQMELLQDLQKAGLLSEDPDDK